MDSERVARGPLKISGGDRCPRNYDATAFRRAAADWFDLDFFTLTGTSEWTTILRPHLRLGKSGSQFLRISRDFVQSQDSLDRVDSCRFWAKV